MELERRFLLTNAETRLAEPEGDTPPELFGYAAVFYKPGDTSTEFELDPGYVVERFLPGCFDDVLRDNVDVRCLFNHNSGAILGRVGSGTLTLSVDQRGLFFRCRLPDTTAGRDVAESVRRGDIPGSSVGMIVEQRNWIEQQDGPVIREIVRVSLYDVGPVTFPAYAGATVAQRSRDQLRDELDRELRQPHARRNRLRALRSASLRTDGPAG